MTFEYLLEVWDRKPENLNHIVETGEYCDLPYGSWKAHITGAHQIPRIGERIVSGSGHDDYSRFKVFAVVHDIGSVLSSLTLEGRSQVSEVDLSKSLAKGLVKVLGYEEAIIHS